MSTFDKTGTSITESDNDNSPDFLIIGLPNEGKRAGFPAKRVRNEGEKHE